MSHTGIDLESIEAVMLFVVARQDVNSALHKSPMRFFALYEFPYTSVLEMRPADELLCRCLYTPYVVVVVCCLEATALHCLVALCGCPCLVLAVLGRWPFFGRSSRFSVQVSSCWSQLGFGSTGGLSLPARRAVTGPTSRRDISPASQPSGREGASNNKTTKLGVWRAGEF